MVVMIVACPVCGSGAQAEGEGVYRNEWDHSMNPPVCRVLKQRAHRCGGCGRLYTTDHGYEMDPDTITAMHGGRANALSASGPSQETADSEVAS